MSMLSRLQGGEAQIQNPEKFLKNEQNLSNQESSLQESIKKKP